MGWTILDITDPPLMFFLLATVENEGTDFMPSKLGKHGASNLEGIWGVRVPGYPWPAGGTMARRRAQAAGRFCHYPSESAPTGRSTPAAAGEDCHPAGSEWHPSRRWSTEHRQCDGDYHDHRRRPGDSAAAGATVLAVDHRVTSRCRTSESEEHYLTQSKPRHRDSVVKD